MWTIRTQIERGRTFLILFLCSIFCAIILFLSPVVGAALVAFILLSSLISARLEWGVYLILITIPLDKLGNLTPGRAVPITVAKVFILLTLAVWLSRLIIRKDIRLPQLPGDNPVNLFMGLFVFFSIFSWVNAQDMSLAVGQTIRRISLLILFFFLVNVIDGKKLFGRCFRVLILASFLLSLIGIFELATGVSALSLVGSYKEVRALAEGSIRIVGPSGDPDFHAAFMIAPSIFAVALIYMVRSRGIKLSLALLYLLLFINVIATGSRGGIIGFFLSLIVFFLLSDVRKKLLAFLTMAALLGMTFFALSFTVKKAPTERFTQETKSMEARVAWTKMGFRIVTEHPFLGIGTGNFLSAYSRYFVGGAPTEPSLPHNSFLHIWLENGTFAFINYLFLYIFSMINCYVVFRESTDRFLKRISVAVMGAICGLAFFALTSNVAENELYTMTFAFSVILRTLHQKDLKLLDKESSFPGSAPTATPV